MNAFVIAGLVLAGWAVIVALLGMRGFPSNRGGERIAIAITAVLFVGAVGSAIADQTKVGERHGPEVEEEAEGAEAPEQSAPPAEEGGGGEPAPPAEEPAPEAEGGGGQPSELTLESDPSGQLKFDKTTLSAKAGPVTITMTNPSPVPHNVSLRGDAVNEEGETIQGEGESVVEAELKAGEYEFYCSVAGHEQGGMKGTLTVE